MGEPNVVRPVPKEVVCGPSARASHRVRALAAGVAVLLLAGCASVNQTTSVSPSPGYVPVNCDDIGARTDDPSRELACYETKVALPLSGSFAQIVETFAPRSPADLMEVPDAQDRCFLAGELAELGQ